MDVVKKVAQMCVGVMLLFVNEWWVANRYLDQAADVLSPTQGTLCQLIGILVFLVWMLTYLLTPHWSTK